MCVYMEWLKIYLGIFYEVWLFLNYFHFLRWVEQIMACSVDCLSPSHHPSIHSSINRCKMTNYIILWCFFWSSKKNRTPKKKPHAHRWAWTFLKMKTNQVKQVCRLFGRAFSHFVERFINNLLNLCQKQWQKMRKKDEKIL